MRSFLKQQHLSDAEIDARLAAVADPLEAVKPFLKNDQASRKLEEKAANAPVGPRPNIDMRSLGVTQHGQSPVSSAPAALDLNAITADMKAAGVLVGEADAADHGLSVGKQVSRTVSPT